MSAASMETTSAAAAVAALSDDLLAVILGRLPARSLAASCRVCMAWHDLIAERHLLLRFRRVLPHAVRGLFINYEDYERPQFLSRPTPAPPEADGGRQIDGKFDFIVREDPDSYYYEITDHCNGLVLLVESHGKALHVCNPATRWSSRLPPAPCPEQAAGATRYYHSWDWGRRAFLVFDPFVCPEYKVLLSPLKELGGNDDDASCLMEWPPLRWSAWHEFSSSTGRWEEKVFVREGEAAAAAGGDLLLQDGWGYHHVEPQCRYAVYWQGSLYIHCHGEYVSRFSLLHDKYRVIKLPIQLAECKDNDVRTFLGRSEKGVYIAAIAQHGLAILRVWTLSESGSQMEWVPKDQSNLKINTYSWSLDNNRFHDPKCWTLDLEPNYWMFDLDNNARTKSLEKNVCWNSDDDNVVDGSEDREDFRPYVKFLGFHPYKEVIFLCSDSNAVAFRLKSPKVQYLGTVHLAGNYNRGIRESFVYTPCLIGD